MTSARDEQRSEVEAVVKKVSEMVSGMAGIQLGERQYSMVESRLRSRMVRLKIDKFKDYLTYLNSKQAEESLSLLSLLTTHHTFFFREFNHFEYLLNKGLPVLIKKARERGDKKIRIWSAASSRGQEAYSLAMFMHFHLSATAKDIDFEIWGSDIDPESVKWAQNGVYKVEELKQAPAMYVEGNWIRGKGDVSGFSKVKDHLKSKCKFATVNLLKSQSFLEHKNFDVIFCRNVYIYFNEDQIKQCTGQFLKHLDSDGFLFLGVSETLNNLKLPVESVGPSVYRHSSTGTVKPTIPKKEIVAAVSPANIKVLCVDDSPAILALLKKILGAGPGFEVVATASNGAEALEMLKKVKVDVITLDLHMPVMDGMQFLSTRTDKSTPVVIVSAINRDDMSIAQKALSLGASDYVEKPSLENIAQASNEIRSKLKTVLSLKGMPVANPSAILSSSSSMEESTDLKKGMKHRVLIVDDSETIQNLLEKIISSDPEMEVIGKIADPTTVDEFIRKNPPDLITLDIHMPKMDGVTLLKKIFPKYKIPTVMISSISKEEGPSVLNALENGAVDYFQKPEISQLAFVGPQIRERLKVAIQSRNHRKSTSKRKAKSLSQIPSGSLILMGASTGGTEAIRHVLESLPSQIPPILIVQHIPAGFSAAFAKRLNELLPFEVKEAVDGDEVLPNRVLIAPGGLQMAVKVTNKKLFVNVNNDAPVNRHKPSVDYMFRSVARMEHPNTIAVIMTGMGADGAQGLKDLRNMGARTIAQDQNSCVVYGMPREAINIGAAELIKPLDDIGMTIVELVESSVKSQNKLVKKIA